MIDILHGIAIISAQVIPTSMTQLWFANKKLSTDKNLSDYVGTNEKTKVSGRELEDVWVGSPCPVGEGYLEMYLYQ